MRRFIRPHAAAAAFTVARQIVIAAIVLVSFQAAPAHVLAASESQSGAYDLLDKRLVQLEGAHNFRDIGGYPTADGHKVKWGLVYRSDNLSKLTAKDWQKVDSLGIRIVCDFRTDRERENYPSNWPASSDVEFIQRSYELDPGNSGYETVAYQQAPTYRAMFDRLSAPSAPPMLVHCTGGADRTGFAAAFLLIALGVDRQYVLDDYSLTQWLRGFHPATREEIAKLQAVYNFKLDADAILAQVSAPDRRDVGRAQMSKALDAIAQKYGSVMAFIRTELGVNDSQLARLRANLLEK